MNTKDTTLTEYDLIILNIIKDSCLYKQIQIGDVGSVTILDIQNITDSNYNAVSDTLVKLICHDLVYFQGEHLYLSRGINEKG